MSTIPTTGVVRFSDLNIARGAAANAFIKLSDMYGFATGVALTGTIKLGDLKGKSAVANITGAAAWAARIGGAADDGGYCICNTSSPSAGTCVAGYYKSSSLGIYNAGESIAFTSLTNSGGTTNTDDCFIVKYNESGVVQWATRIGGSGNGNELGYGISSTSDGGICVTGTYSSTTLTCWSSSGAAFTSLPNANVNLTTRTSIDSYDCLVVKYNSLGVGEWATRIGNSLGNEVGTSIVGSTGINPGIYITGYYTTATVYSAGSTVAFTSAALLGGSTSGPDILMVKYNNSGQCAWFSRVTTSSGASLGIDSGLGICSTSDGGVYVTGRYRYNLQAFHAGTSTSFVFATGGASDSLIILKYNSLGVGEWGVKGLFIAPGYSICSADDGVYVTTSGPLLNLSYVNNTSTAIAITQMTSNGGTDCFVLKFSLNGVYQWGAKLIGGTLQEIGYGICSTIGPSAGICVTGSSTSPNMLVYNVGETTTPISSITNAGGTANCFLVKYNNAGLCQWMTRIEGTGADSGNGTCPTSDGGVCITGYYSSAAPVYNSNGNTVFTTLPSLLGGVSDCFLVKYM